MSAARRKGSAFARDVCAYLRDELGLPVERRVDGGSKDRGDVAGIPDFVLELKACRQTDLAGWVAEAEKEAANDGAPYWAVISKRRMKSTNQAYVVMSLDVWARWYRENHS